MARLIDRNKQIPQGFIFMVPGIDWKPAPFSSIRVIAEGAISVLRANPHVAQKLGWDLSLEGMMNRVDETNAMVCEKMGWNDYVTGGSGGAANPFPQPTPRPPPIPRASWLPNAAASKTFTPPSESPRSASVVSTAVASVKKLASGAATLLEWEEAGYPHVEQSVAERRASVCSSGGPGGTPCPMNAQGKDLSEYFTVPLANLIKKRIERMNELDLKTTSDTNLFTCQGCLCPLRTKVWMPAELIAKRLKPEARGDLSQSGPKCWILDEVA